MRAESLQFDQCGACRRSGATNEVLRNKGYAVLRYLKTDGGQPDLMHQPPAFEIVRTYRYDDKRVRWRTCPWDVATTITLPTTRIIGPERLGHV